jgi:hypothetical protein
MRKTVVLAKSLLLSVALVAVASSAFANVAAMKIDGVEFAANGSTMTILGKQFDTGPLNVSIEGVGQLTVLSSGNATIETVFPSGLVGDYTLSVSTGAGNKKNADFELVNLAGTMHIVCIDWYLTAGHDDHIHAEAFLQDQYGNPVIGAAVEMSNTVDTGTEVREWLRKSSTTFKYAGYNHGESCQPNGIERDSGATGQFCCIGLGAHEPFCPSGWFEADVISVLPPAGSNATWDGVTPANGREFVMDQF